MPVRKRHEPPAYRVRLGRRLAQLRKARGLSQADLAEAIGTATESVSRIERAAAVPSLGLLAQIASVLGIDVEDLFSSSATTSRSRMEPDLAKLLALVGTKPPALRRRVVRLIRMFLAR